ncbi:MAG: COP23 domain-containing protein [Nostoc sp.]|uniref:COP23 domain-containing protein n=1 Tax=Nostoc sp. TaxID=1180 RepID=UPI002FFA412A
MIYKISTKLLMSAIVSSIFVLPSEFGLAQTQPTRKADVTTFHCIRQGKGFATVARRGSRQTGAMITWNSTAFGPKFTPQKRCELVSQRLSKAVISSGGKLSTLKLTHGIVGSNPVVCYINSTREVCNPNNLILTLNQSERGQEEQVLNEFKKFSVGATSTPLSREADGRTIIRLGVQIDKAFETDNATEPATPDASVAPTQEPTPLSTPSNQPLKNNGI